MSFQLYFYRQQHQAALSLDEIQTALLSFEHANMVENGSSLEFEYENPITGVYFWLTYTRHGFADEQIAHFEGFRYTGLSFVLNYFRPSYFMYEANFVLFQLMKSLQLYVFDPQADAASTVPYLPFSDELVRSWQTSNRRIGSKSPNRVTLQREKARYAWEYLHQYAYFKTLLPDDHFVPKLFFIRFRDEKVHTAVVFPYPDVERQLIPDVDYLYVKTSRKHLWINRPIEGLIPFEQLQRGAPDAFQSYTDPVPYYLLQNRETLASVLQECEVIKRDKFTVLANDGFVDFEPPQPHES